MQQEWPSVPSRPSLKNLRMEKLGSIWNFETHRITSYAKCSLKSELETKWCKKQKPAPQFKVIIGTTQTGLAGLGSIHGFPMRIAGAVETWTSLKWTWSKRRREWPLLLAKQSGAHGWTGRELRPGNSHGFTWWLWNPSLCPPFFIPTTTSFPPC